MKASFPLPADDPWVERTIAALQAQRPKDAVRDHLDALATSSSLTQTYRRMYRPMDAPVLPEIVIDVLNRAGVRPVLMGTHGVGGWRSRARATQDVNVLVRKNDLKKSIRALHEAYPNLSIKDTPVVTRFIDPSTGMSAIDVMKPMQRVFQLVFRHTIPVGDTHDIPDLEMALISKFAAMVSPNRERLRKMQATVDFADVVAHNRSVLDFPKLRRLAENVYPGASDEVSQIIADIDAGREIHL